jgi:hypothetical protein
MTHNPRHVLLTGAEVTELRLTVPEPGKRLLPLPVAAWHATVSAAVHYRIAMGDRDRVLVRGPLVRRFVGRRRVIAPGDR